MNLAALLHGQAADVADMLEDEASPLELRMALVNALTRIHRLENPPTPNRERAIQDRLPLAVHYVLGRIDGGMEYAEALAFGARVYRIPADQLAAALETYANQAGQE